MLHTLHDDALTARSANRIEGRDAVITRFTGITMSELAEWRQEAPARSATAHCAALVRAGAIYREIAATAELTAAEVAAGRLPKDHDPEMVDLYKDFVEGQAQQVMAFATITSTPLTTAGTDLAPADADDRA